MLLLLLGACNRGPTQIAPAAPEVNATPEVNVLVAEQAAVPLELNYSARTRGEREVEVRARVSGILLKRYYREGESVAANALLFRIDDAPFVQEVGRLRGLEAVERARLVEATDQRDRLVALFQKGFISRHDIDAAVATYSTAAASAEAAKAALHQAQLNLSYTEVRAPIAGATGRESRSEGSLVEAGGPSSLLTTIVQSDRLYVDFAMPEDEARTVRTAMQKGPVAVRLAPGDKGELEQTARLEFLDTRIDADSGTVSARALLDNNASNLAPGQFVLARIDGLLSAPAIHIPGRAVLNTPNGPMVWIVKRDSKVQPRPLDLGGSNGNLVEVSKGLVPGDRIVVDGILKVQPGATVRVSTVAINDPPGGNTQSSSSPSGSPPSGNPPGVAAPK